MISKTTRTTTTRRRCRRLAAAACLLVLLAAAPAAHAASGDPLGLWNQWLGWWQQVLWGVADAGSADAPDEISGEICSSDVTQPPSTDTQSNGEGDEGPGVDPIGLVAEPSGG